MYKFIPILKQTIWGGNRIAAFKRMGSNIPERIGESWEVSGVEGHISVVADGPEAGKTLTDLLVEHRGALVGQENYERFGTEFPLLVKFIDAHQDLSIQVHPNDEVARRHGFPRGKTEMWYALKSVPGAQLYNGLRQTLSADDYRRMVADGSITKALAHYSVHDGDVFYIPAGRIHAIGAGCFVVEIQQTSDVTYRIYDYQRRDKHGNLRQLHTAEAAEAIDYTVKENYRTYYEPMQDEPVQLISCPHFTTAVYDLNEPMTIDYSELDSFVILVGLQGSGEITDESGETTTFIEGETVLLPATVKSIKVEGTIKFLETYV